MSQDHAAKELLMIALNRLNEFYNRALYKAPPKRDLSEEERIVVNNGGTLAPTNPPGGVSGTAVTYEGFESFVQTDAGADVAPPPPPEAVEAYKNKGQEHSAVTKMINLLITDLDKEIE